VQLFRFRADASWWERINLANYLGRSSAAEEIRIKTRSTSARRGAPTKVKPPPIVSSRHFVFFDIGCDADNYKATCVSESVKQHWHIAWQS
jgi:hypothetical protein